jgi:CHAT domain-containing protein
LLPEAADLPPLPGAAGEVQAAATAYGAASRLLLEGGAREGDARAAAATADVVHIAAHAYFNARQPVDSALLLRGGGASGADDGLVHAWEVMADWRLQQARLVVLSACETGLGRDLADEGLIGLTRAFHYAGARQVVASLWPVTDAPTARLMQRLHAAMAAGGDAALALQRAQQDSLAASGTVASASQRGAGALARPADVARRDPVYLRHPVYWAGFELFGPLR